SCLPQMRPRCYVCRSFFDVAARLQNGLTATARAGQRDAAAQRLQRQGASPALVAARCTLSVCSATALARRAPTNACHVRSAPLAANRQREKRFGTRLLPGEPDLEDFYNELLARPRRNSTAVLSALQSDGRNFMP